jgi:hypothetical protein
LSSSTSVLDGTRKIKKSVLFYMSFIRLQSPAAVLYRVLAMSKPACHT